MLLDTLLRRKPRAKPVSQGHRCPLCGRAFTAEEAALCTSCPLAQRCGLVMCPGCGYEFAPD